MQMAIARPCKTTGRVVLGPRSVRDGYARIVARADGSGRIEFYHAETGAWVEALERCSFDDIWSAPAAVDLGYAALGSYRP